MEEKNNKLKKVVFIILIILIGFLLCLLFLYGLYCNIGLLVFKFLFGGFAHK